MFPKGSPTLSTPGSESESESHSAGWNSPGFAPGVPMLSMLLFYCPIYVMLCMNKFMHVNFYAH